MRIFATADIHGHPRIMERMATFVEEYQFDKIIICGDVLQNPSETFKKYIKLQEENYKQFQEYVNNLGTPVLYILGNDDWVDGDINDPCYLSSQQGCFVPFEYISPTPADTNREAKRNKMVYELNKLRVNPGTIVVAHCMPRGCRDQILGGTRVGSTAIREFLRDNEPMLWLGGHIHEAFGCQRMYNTTVFNCACFPQYNKFRGWAIEIAEDYKIKAQQIEIKV